MVIGDTLIGMDAVIFGLLTEVAVIVTVAFVARLLGGVYVIEVKVSELEGLVEVGVLMEPKSSGTMVQLTP